MKKALQALIALNLAVVIAFEPAMADFIKFDAPIVFRSQSPSWSVVFQSQAINPEARWFEHLLFFSKKLLVKTSFSHMPRVEESWGFTIRLPRWRLAGNPGAWESSGREHFIPLFPVRIKFPWTTYRVQSPLYDVVGGGGAGQTPAALAGGSAFTTRSKASDINPALRLNLIKKLDAARRRGNFGVLSVAMEMPIEKGGKKMKRHPGGGGQGVFMSEQPWAVSQRGPATSVVSPLIYDDLLLEFDTPDIENALKAYMAKYGAQKLMDIELPLGGGTYPLSIYYVEQDGVPVLQLFDPKGILFRRLYSSPHPDSVGGYLEAILLPLAAIEVMRQLQIQYEVMHFNDWQAALGPVMLATLYDKMRWPLGHRPAGVFTFHNLEYQGIFPGRLPLEPASPLTAYLAERRVIHPGAKDLDLFQLTGLSRSLQNDVEKGLEYYANHDGKHNLMKGGALYSPKILSVSEGHAKEAFTPQRGYGLDGLFRRLKNSMGYVYNGVRADRNQAERLDALDRDGFKKPTDASGRVTPLSRLNSFEQLQWKEHNRLALQKKLGLEVSKDNQILGFVTRIVKQKGLNILTTVMPSGKTLLEEILDMRPESAKGKNQVVILGTPGDPIGESQAQFFREFLNQHPQYRGQFVFEEKFDPVLAKQIGAGSDMVGMFSIDEPGGIANQELALLLALVIATDRGGLQDFKKRGGTPLPLVNGFEIDPGSEAEAQRVRSAQQILDIIRDIRVDYSLQPSEYAKTYLEPLSRFQAAWGNRAGEYVEAYIEAISSVVQGFRQELEAMTARATQDPPNPENFLQNLQISSPAPLLRPPLLKFLIHMKRDAKAFRGARVLDLTARSGAKAAYAALLGAREVIAIVHDQETLADVQANAERQGVENQVRVVQKDLLAERVEDLGTFDIVLFDPDPYYDTKIPPHANPFITHGLPVDKDGRLLFAFLREIGRSSLRENGKALTLLDFNPRVQNEIRQNGFRENLIHILPQMGPIRGGYALVELKPGGFGGMALTEKNETVLPPLEKVKVDPELGEITLSPEQLHAFRGLFEEMTPPSHHADRMNHVIHVMKLDIKNPANAAIASSLASLWFSASNDDLAKNTLLRDILGNEANKNGLMIRFAEAGALHGAQSAWYPDPSNLYKSIIVVDGSFISGLREAGHAWSEADLDLSLSLLGQLLAERIWVHEAAHQRVGRTLTQQQREELRIMRIEQVFNRGTQQAFGSSVIESMLEKVKISNPSAYKAISAARRYRLYRSFLSTLIPGEEMLEKLVVRLYDRLQPYGQTMQMQGADDQGQAGFNSATLIVSRREAVKMLRDEGWIEVGLHTMTGGKGHKDVDASELIAMAQKLLNNRMMPAVDKLEILRALRANPQNNDKLICFLLEGQPELAEAAAAAGANVLNGQRLDSETIRRIHQPYPHIVFIEDISQDETPDEMQAHMASASQAGVDGVLLKPFFRKDNDWDGKFLAGPLSVNGIRSAHPEWVIMPAAGVRQHNASGVIARAERLTAAVGFNPAGDFDEQLAEYEFARADGRTRESGRIEKFTFESWGELSKESQERVLKQAIENMQKSDLSRAVALLSPIEQSKPLRIAFVPKEFKADPRYPFQTLIDLFRWQRLTKNAQLADFFTSWDSPEEIQSHFWRVPGRGPQKIRSAINLRRALRPGGGQPTQDCTLCNPVIQKKYPAELWLHLGQLLIYFNPFPVDVPKRQAAIRDQPMRMVAVWAGGNAANGHVSQADVYEVPYLREFRTQWMRLNAGFALAWWEKFRIEINGWGYGKEGNHGGASQDHIHAHFFRRRVGSEQVPVVWDPRGMPDHPNIRMGLVNMLPEQNGDLNKGAIALAFEAQGSELIVLDEAVSKALKTIARDKDSFDVIYFESSPQAVIEWLGSILRKLGLGPWLPASLGPRIRVLLTGRIKAQPENGTPLGAYQVVGLENIVEGNPSRYYRLTNEQRAEYESIQNIEDKITLLNHWLKDRAVERLSDQELFDNFRSELQQTTYSAAQVQALLERLTESLYDHTHTPPRNRRAA